VVSMGPCKREATYVAARSPLGDAGVRVRDASTNLADNCKASDGGPVCTGR